MHASPLELQCLDHLTYCVICKVTALQVSTNNRASTVLNLFREAEQDFGTPSRMRGDRGGENIDVATYMVMKRGPNRGSFLWGS